MTAKSVKAASVTVENNSETTTAILTGTEDFPKRILAINCDSIAGVRLVAYLDETQVIDAPADLVNSQHGITNLGVELAVGKSLKVGFNNASGTSQTLEFLVEYESAKA